MALGSRPVRLPASSWGSPTSLRTIVPAFPRGIAPLTTLCHPNGIAFDSHGNLWVADSVNNRALEYLNGSGFTTGQAARPLGQTHSASSDCDGDAYALIPSPSTLCGPDALAFDSHGNLWVVDTANNRVLEFNRVTEPIVSPSTASTEAPLSQ